MGMVNSAGASLETCVDHERSSRESRRPTVPKPMEQQSAGLVLLRRPQWRAEFRLTRVFPAPNSPNVSSWAEASHWACDALNRTATTANPESKSPHVAWLGSSPLVVLLSFLKPGCCKVRRENKSQAKAQEWRNLALHPTTPETYYGGP